MQNTNKKFWLLTGTEENWETALNSEVWGAREGPLVNYWKKLSKGDFLFFYVKSPISGIIGVGQVESKFKQNEPLWPDEVREKRVIYPYRFGFRTLGVLKPSNWRKDTVLIRDLKVSIQSGINSLSSSDALKEVVRRVKEKWELKNLEIGKQPKTLLKEQSVGSVHNQIRDKLQEIGVIEGFISDKEYQIDGERLDVAWRRVIRGVPTKIFEVQVGGSPHQALEKLKHGFDLWNSEPYLITDKKSKRKVDELLAGTFHELKLYIKVISLEKVENLYQSLIDQKNLKEEFGLS
jgi:predicted RNA-binding protein